MHTKRLRLEGATLPELQARVLAEHGAGARIIAAEQVTVGGIRGFFAKRHIEVTVEVPPSPVQVLVERGSERRRRARDEMTTRLGIAALLDEADAAESRLHTDPPSERRAARRSTVVPDVSTGTPDFARLMDELTFATSPARRQEPGSTAAPAESAEPTFPPADDSTTPLTSTSPLTSTVSQTSMVSPTSAAALASAAAPTSTAAPSDAAAASTAPGHPPAPSSPAPSPSTLSPSTLSPPALSPQAPPMLHGPGDLILLLGLPDDVMMAAALLSAGPSAPLYDERDQVTDRRSALAVRARGVERGRSVLVSHSSGVPAAPGADQVWAVVHAGRKPADTARWVRDAGALVTIDAVAVLGWDTTSTPHTVLELGLPIGWLAPAGPSQPFAIG